MFEVVRHLLSVEVRPGENWSSAHRQFLATQIMSSALALLAFPLWVLSQGEVTHEMALVFGWFLGPLVAAATIVRTRSLDTAFFITSLAVTGLICTVCALTGGTQSFALVWLLIIPFEAALSERRRVVLCGLGAVFVGLALLFILEEVNALSAYPAIPSSEPLGLALGPIAVILYCAALTFRVQAVYRQTELRLAKNEERYRLLAENATDLITRHEPTGDVVFASPSARTLMGVDPDALQADGFLSRVHVADRPAYMTLMSDVVSRGLPLVGEFRVKTAVRRPTELQSTLGDVEHDFSWVEMRCRPIWNEEQSIVGIVAITHDVNERRAQEDALLEAHENLQELSDAKSRFLANMSHELRTPLNAIIGFSEILEQGLFEELRNAKQKEYVGLIRESGSHLLQVVTDILDMSKIESGTFDIVPEPFEVDHLVRTCTSIMSQQADLRGIHLKTMIPKDLPLAVADPRACRQILINLISNALKFSDKDDSVVVGVRVEGRNFAYFVRDTGIGMSDIDLKRIGQPFFQADSALDRRYEGTGLGVSVVKGLAELHRGRVVFESELGRGTCVTVYIPLDCEARAINVEPLVVRNGEKVEPKLLTKADGVRAAKLEDEGAEKAVRLSG
ncbi:MAG: ATP-binding protein [Pseudomonadota bacterium]